MKRAIINNATLAYFILKICELILVVAKKSLKKSLQKMEELSCWKIGLDMWNKKNFVCNAVDVCVHSIISFLKGKTAICNNISKENNIEYD